MVNQVVVTFQRFFQFSSPENWGEDASILTTAHIFQMGWNPTQPTMGPDQLGIFPEPTNPFGADGGIAPARRGRVPHHSQAGAWWGLVEAERTVTWRVGRPGYGDVFFLKAVWLVRVCFEGFDIYQWLLVKCYGWACLCKGKFDSLRCEWLGFPKDRRLLWSGSIRKQQGWLYQSQVWFSILG